MKCAICDTIMDENAVSECCGADIEYNEDGLGNQYMRCIECNELCSKNEEV